MEKGSTARYPRVACLALDHGAGSGHAAKSGCASRWVALAAGLATGSILLAVFLSGAVGAEGAAGSHGAAQLQASQTAEAQVQETASNVVLATGSVRGLRVLVVDERGAITAVFSNTPDEQTPVEVRLGRVNGPRVDTTLAIQRQYEKLAAQVDWGRTGLVYQRR